MPAQAIQSLPIFVIIANGVSMDAYHAVDEAAALDAYARDAGYTDFAALTEAHPNGPDDSGVVAEQAS